jgi:crossover junction endodeoxyribonuclease RuvC
MSFADNPNQQVTPQSRYLGIDPGLNRTGYALLERHASGPSLVEGGIIRSCPKESLQYRVHEIASGIREVIDELSPDVVAMEQIFSHGRNLKTALQLAHLRGALLMALADASLPVVHYSPTQVKRLLTGSGRAPKEQIQHAVKAELRLSTIPEPNDVADASAVALCLYHSVRFAA